MAQSPWMLYGVAPYLGHSYVLWGTSSSNDLSATPSFAIYSLMQVYQAYYQFHQFQSHSPSAISWIGTVQVFLMGFTAVLSGALFDRGYARFLLCTGCTLVVLGLFMLSLAEDYYAIILSQGVCMGIGK